MADKQIMAEIRKGLCGGEMNWKAVYCSTSIANFKEKLARKFGLPEWHFLKSMWKPAAFFGMYNSVDYFRFLWHRGERTVFWCGGDILNLESRPVWQRIMRMFNARHICENEIERYALEQCGIKAEIRPCLIDGIEDVGVCYKQSDNPHVYLCAHPGREGEYGIEEIEHVARLCPQVTFHIYGITRSNTANVQYHGRVPSQQFNTEIMGYQAAIRLNTFDGFSEILARSAIMGQYQFTRIEYPHMEYVRDEIDLLHGLSLLKYKNEPNLSGRNYWLKELSKPL